MQSRVRQHLSKHNGEENASEGGPCNGDAHRCPTFLLEILSCCGEGRRDTHSDAKSSNEPLREDELIVLFAQAGHHNGEDVDDCCRPQNLLKPALRFSACFTGMLSANLKRKRISLPQHRIDRTMVHQKVPQQRERRFGETQSRRYPMGSCASADCPGSTFGEHWYDGP